MSTTYRTVVITSMSCPVCGVTYGLDEHYRERRVEDGKSWVCPNGHSLSYHETEADRLRKELAREVQAKAWARRDANHQRDLAQHERRSKAAIKGQLTRHKKRVAHGVCPCCKRTFKQLDAHMKNKHPDFVKKNG